VHGAQLLKPFKVKHIERIVSRMISKKKLKIVYGIIIYLMFVGVLCYAAFPVKPPETPIRLMYKVTAGKVLFDHNAHTSDSGYGLSCFDCHHHPMDDDSAVIACSECHNVTEDATLPPEKCGDCHDAEEIKDTKMLKRSDAFHAGCISCHQNVEAGPVECSSCHVM
jgi:hypothetical protein